MQIALIPARPAIPVNAPALLLTNGQANHGITDPEVLVRHAAELTEEGITTTTLGYGEDFNEDLLTGMADAGRGRPITWRRPTRPRPSLPGSRGRACWPGRASGQRRRSSTWRQHPQSHGRVGRGKFG
jgi:hypothetical protein